MAVRLQQNFNGSRALIVCNRPAAVEMLVETLAKLGVSSQFAPIVDGRAQIDLASLSAERDMLFVDGDLDGVLGFGDGGPAPVPLIGLIGVETPGRLKSLVNLGATGFLRKPVHGAAVYAVLFLAINQFLLREEQNQRIDTLEHRRRGRRAVIKAVVALMAEAGIDDEEAFARLRREAMRQRMGVEDYCELQLRRRTDLSAPAATREIPAPAVPVRVPPGGKSLRGR